mmetsp:Transcript_15273/g.14661  ORF Transcript_15273/g.14661 Transcript_15273/m.14661 type:complete len:500 (+) Transcript_15273:138-1637(+)
MIRDSNCKTLLKSVKAMRGNINYVTSLSFFFFFLMVYIIPNVSATIFHSVIDSFPFRLFRNKGYLSKSVPILSSAIQSDSKDQSKLTGSSLNAKGFKAVIPPILLFLFSVSKCEASALNPQKIALRGPFFQGWLVRTTDHINQLSFILIIGSFSSKGLNKYDEHYIFCGVETEDQGTLQYEAFPSPESVIITGSPPNIPFPIPNMKSPFIQNLNITWSANDIGKFKFNEEECSADFKLAGSHIKFSSRNRLPWSESHTHSAGPEGWLGYTSLLPCHYFVHSVGSECTYSLKLPSCEKESTCSNNQENNDNTVKNTMTTEYTGKGYTHIEGNHGSFFPSGWVWSQAILEDNKASFGLTAGKFEIGAIEPMTFILFVRKGDKRTIFRTTGLDDIRYTVDGIVGFVNITAYSLGGMDRVNLIIKPKTSISEGSFGSPLYIPTATGFTNRPGCIETYTAVANFIISEYNYQNQSYVESDRIEFPLTALEFGGSFQGIKLSNDT